MNILALDLATRTGWALAENGAVVSGVQIFDVRRGESPGMRYLRFNRWLDEIGARADLIVYEQAHNRGGAATEIANGLVTRVLEFCAAHPPKEHASVHSATLKKFATGSGKADKSVMLERARHHFGNWVIDDNEADALFMLKYAQVTYGQGNGEGRR